MTRPTDQDAAAEIQAIAEDIEALSRDLQPPPAIRAQLTDATRLLRLARAHYEARASESDSRATGARGRWYIADTAVLSILQLTRLASTPQQATRLLTDESRRATLRASDDQGRQLWRTPRPAQLKMVVDTRPAPGGDLPRLIWAGRGRPPSWCWDSGEDRAQAAPSGRRER